MHVDVCGESVEHRSMRDVARMQNNVCQCEVGAYRSRTRRADSIDVRVGQHEHIDHPASVLSVIVAPTLTAPADGHRSYTDERRTASRRLRTCRAEMIPSSSDARRSEHS